MVENEEEVVVKSKGSNLVLILVTVLLLVVLIVGGLVIFLLMGSSDENEDGENVKQEKVEKPKKKKQAESAELGIIFPLEGFTVNLVSDSGAKYLKCKIELEQNIETLTPELEKKVTPIRDIIINLLSSKSVEEISTNKGKDRLKEEIINKINEILNDGFIKNIYFTDFIIS